MELTFSGLNPINEGEVWDEYESREDENINYR